MRKLVIVRPQPGAGQSAARAAELGLDARLLPLFAVEPIEWEVPDPLRFDALVATSANAFRHGGEKLSRLRGLPVHAVGQVTAAAARQAGFTVAAVGDGGREQIPLPDGRLLHLAGTDHLPIAGEVETIAVYASRALAPPGPDAFSDAVVAIHSPRAGRRLAELVAERSRTAIAAISANAADACGEGWERVGIAEHPNEGALLALAAELCQTMTRP